MLKKEKAIFYLIVGICAAALVILAVVGLVLQSQPTVTVSLPSSLEHSSSALESSRVSELAQPASSASSQAQGGVEGITLSAYEISLTVGETQMPLVTMTPETSEIWASSDGTVATVDGMGRITGVGVGSCTVTVTSAANPAVSASVEVTVSARATAAPTSSAAVPVSEPAASVSTPSVTPEPEPTPTPTPEPTPEPSQPEESAPEESTPSTPEEEVSQIVPGV